MGTARPRPPSPLRPPPLASPPPSALRRRSYTAPRVIGPCWRRCGAAAAAGRVRRGAAPRAWRARTGRRRGAGPAGPRLSARRVAPAASVSAPGPGRAGRVGEDDPRGWPRPGPPAPGAGGSYPFRLSFNFGLQHLLDWSFWMTLTRVGGRARGASGGVGGGGGGGGPGRAMGEARRRRRGRRGGPEVTPGEPPRARRGDGGRAGVTRPWGSGPSRAASRTRRGGDPGLPVGVGGPPGERRLDRVARPRQRSHPATRALPRGPTRLG